MCLVIAFWFVDERYSARAPTHDSVWISAVTGGGGWHMSYLCIHTRDFICWPKIGGFIDGRATAAQRHTSMAYSLNICQVAKVHDLLEKAKTYASRQADTDI